MDTTSFRFLLAFTFHMSLHIYLVIVVTTYLHGILIFFFIFYPRQVFFHIYQVLNLVDILVIECIKHYMV